MISIVLVGRNDNYGGDFENRLFSTLSYNTARLKESRVAHEIIFVEWNPIPTNPLLSPKIIERFDNATCYVVDNDVHEYLSENKNIKVYEYLAKNVGAKRAKGEWLLITNPDDFFGKSVIEFLAKQDFNPQALYRTGWVDIRTEDQIDSPDLRDAYVNDPPPYNCASGDFIYIHKMLFNSVGGFSEYNNLTDLHKDSLLCSTVFKKINTVYKVGNVYHLHHERDNDRERRIHSNFNNMLLKIEMLLRAQKNYGLTDITKTVSISNRFNRLELAACLKAVLFLKKIIPFNRYSWYKFLNKLKQKWSKNSHPIKQRLIF